MSSILLPKRRSRALLVGSLLQVLPNQIPRKDALTLLISLKMTNQFPQDKPGV
jgi:hypothetical protein